MVTDKETLLGNIEEAWQELTSALARVPADRIEEPGVVELWSVRDLIGHVTTWEAEAIKSLQDYVVESDVSLLAWPDVDALNERTVRAKQGMRLDDLQHEFGSTHQTLIRFLGDLAAEEFAVPAVENRIRIDTFAHYQEHTEHINQWLGPGAR